MAYVINLSEMQSGGRPRRSRQRGYVHLLALGSVLVLGALVLRFSPFRLGVVVGESMTPTLRPNYVFVLDKGFYEHTSPTRGEIVVAIADGETCVKRVAAGPGEDLWLIEYAPDGNKHRYTEVVKPHDVSRVQRVLSRNPGLGRLQHLYVPEGRVFLVGDAQNISLDSRNFGPIPTEQIMGRVLPMSAKEPFIMNSESSWKS